MVHKKKEIKHMKKSMTENKKAKLSIFFLNDSSSSSEKSLGVVMAPVIQESESLASKFPFSLC